MSNQPAIIVPPSANDTTEQMEAFIKQNADNNDNAERLVTSVALVSEVRIAFCGLV